MRVRVGGTSNAGTSGGSSTFNEGSPPSTGTSSATNTVWNRINSLTRDPSTGLQAIGQASYGFSCSNATSSTPTSTCTITGPVGAAACNTADFVITPQNNTISFGAVTRTNAGSAASGATVDYAPFLSTINTFSSGYTAQSANPSGLGAVATGTIANTATTMTGGSSSAALTIDTNANGTSAILTMSGGLAPSGANNWQLVGSFKRYDVIAANNSYSRGSGRTDCSSTTCTYSEELQNFANWYSYYRTRMLSMKTTSSLAFNQMTGSFRIGFDDICNCSSGTCANTVKQGAAQFIDSGGEVANQRSNWWTQLTTSTPSCSTPLRGETAKIGLYYAGKLTSADPMQYSCQQNFMLLVTDGYWNENDSASMKKVDGSDIGNTDNNLTTSPRPFYDGQQSSTSCPGLGARTSASSCRTLADITNYYYSTDLRSTANGNATNPSTGVDVATNNVPITQADNNSAQHMTFFAMGLGISGTLNYRPDYATAGIGDYANIVAGTTNWPAVKNLDPTAVDDLWHAAVNGHGKYFSARNPTSVTAGLVEALNKIGERVGSAAAAATSNLEPVAGDNFAYLASYVTVDWIGDLQSRSIDLTSGAISHDTNCGATGSGCQWSAQTMLANTIWSARRIFLAPTSNTSGDPLRHFTYSNLTAAEAALMDPSSLSQYAAIHAGAPTDPDINASNLVDFLAGNRTLEQDGDVTHAQIWRRRSQVLGDFVDTQPVYVRAPSRAYLDQGYAAFKSSGTAASRNPVVYISGNDGMLHAFNAHTANVTISGASVPPGGELWAYIPQQSLPGMGTLGDVNYVHRYFVNGPITVGDVDFGNSHWHSILVGAMGGGGASYYALDVTDPLNPTFLWEFTLASKYTGDVTFDSHMGFSFGNASLNKLPNGSWAVFFTSGYNNSNGIGYLFALDPASGAQQSGFPLSTTALTSGTATTPSNLGKISAWVTDPATNNTAEYIYGGDLLGDMWRFDPDSSATGHTGIPVFKLAHLANASNVAQPITTKPELSLTSTGQRVVFTGSGQYLGIPDLATTQTQTLYAMKDTLGAPNRSGISVQATWDPRLDTTVISSTTVNSFQVRKLIETDNAGTQITKTVNSVVSIARQICNGASSVIDHSTGLCASDAGPNMDWSTYGGWYVDLPDSGERMNVDMNLVLGTLIFASNIPASTACTSGGTSWLNYIDFNTGLQVPNADKYVSTKFGNALIVGITTMKLPSGALVTAVNLNDNSQATGSPPANVVPFSGRRSLWREFEVW